MVRMTGLLARGVRHDPAENLPPSAHRKRPACRNARRAFLHIKLTV